jgi:hypothetical protein
LKNQTSQLTKIIILSAVALAGLIALAWGNYRYAQQNPGGNDFLVHWVGTRSLVTQGLDPYSDEVAIKIQTMAYGRPAQPGEHELRVAYPLYSVVVFLPFALVSNFTQARALWMTVLEVALVMLTFLSLRLARWRVNPLMLGLLLIFSLLWYHGLRPLINGNAVILVALGLVGGFLALRSGADELAGVLFAFTTIKPQVVVLVLAFVVIWAFFNGRMRVIGWLFGTVILFTAAAALIVPNWIVENFREVLRYPSYNPPGTPRAAFMVWWPSFGSRVGWALSAVMALTLLIEWWSNRNAEFSGFLWTACLTLAISQWIGIQTDPGNFVVLLPAIILVFAQLADRWRAGGWAFVVLSLLVLFIGIWAVFLKTVEHGAQPVQSPIMFFPLPAFLLITLYWVRWWAVAPPTVWYDMLDGR